MTILQGIIIHILKLRPMPTFIISPMSWAQENRKQGRQGICPEFDREQRADGIGGRWMMPARGQ
jgi:hypothetical protein